jgi:hypothetical protein
MAKAGKKSSIPISAVLRRGVAGIYNRSPYAREVRKALAKWADHLRNIT